MDLSLQQRVALVIGSSQGIRRAAAELFAREGARVAITYRRNKSKAEAVASAVEQFVFFQQVSMPFDQSQKQVEGFRSERNGLPIAQQKALRRIKAERTEFAL